KERRIQNLAIAALFYVFGLTVFYEDMLPATLIFIGGVGLAFTRYFGWFKWLALVISIFTIIVEPLTRAIQAEQNLWELVQTTSGSIAAAITFFFPRKVKIVISSITICLMTTIIYYGSFEILQWTPPQPAGFYEKPETTAALGAAAYRPFDYVENVIDSRMPLREKAGTGMTIMAKYTKLVVIPFPLSFYYGYKIIEKTDMLKPVPLITFVILILLLVLSFVCIYKNPPVAASLLIYIIGLLAVSNIFKPIPGMMGDRFLFVPSLGFCMLAGILFARLSRFRWQKPNGTALQSLPGYFKYPFIGLLLLYSGITIVRNAQWHDALTLMRHDIRHLDESAQAHNLLATHLVKKSFASNDNAIRQRLLQEAELHYERAVALYPEFFNAFYDLGRVRLMMGKFREAEPAFLKVIQLDSTFSEPLLQLGIAKINTGDCRGAIYYLRKYSQAHPENFDVLTNLSFCYMQLGDFQSALTSMRNAMIFLPASPEPLINLSKIFLEMGISDSASYYLRQAERLAPHHRDIIQLKNELAKPK
ncbi:MAG TPA: tetratricopeptide repeat protein, partial [Chitinophagales bacterium]|nr:tetratricopeptide repeat protein [Chitinophagales bacterium]